MRNPQEPFIWTVISCTVSSTKSRQKSTKVTEKTAVKKLVNLSGSFEDTAKFSYEPMESFENSRYPCVFVTVCDNPSTCILNTLQFVHVETGQTLKRESCSNQALSVSLISLVLSNPPEIMHLNEAYLTNIVDMISKGEISIKPDTMFLYNKCWMHEFTKYPNWEIGI